MGHAGIDVEVRWHTSLEKTCGVGDVLVPKCVKRPDADEGTRQSAQVDGTGGCRVARNLACASGEIAEIALPAEQVRRPCPDDEVVLMERSRRIAVVQHRVQEQLEAKRDLAAVAGEQGDRSGEASAGAGAADADVPGVDPEVAAVLRRPPQGGITILEWCRVRVLRD